MTERVLEHGHLLWAGADFRRILGHNKLALPICGGRECAVCARAERRGQSPRPTAKSKWELGGWEDESEQPAQDVPDPSFSESSARRLLETKDTVFTAKSV